MSPGAHASLPSPTLDDRGMLCPHGPLNFFIMATQQVMMISLQQLPRRMGGARSTILLETMQNSSNVVSRPGRVEIGLAR